MPPSNSTFKNPLAQALGIALRKKRNDMGKSTSDIAEDLGIGPSFYGLVESGTNYLHTSKSIALVDAFEEEFTFDAVSKILVTLSVMEMTAKKAMGENASYIDGLISSVERLSAYDDKKIGILLNTFNQHGIFDEISSQKPAQIAKLIIKYEIDKSISEFLTDYKNFGVPKEEAFDHYLSKKIDTTPSIYFSLLDTTIEQLSTLPIAIEFESLWKWEKKNESNFVELYAFSYADNNITGKRNLERYKYSYLWSDNFKKCNMVLCSKDSSTGKKKEFTENLSFVNANLADKNLSTGKKYDNALSKIHFTCIDKNTDNNNLLIKKLLTGKFENYEGVIEERLFSAVWVFVFSNGNKVGFLADILSDKQSDLIESRLARGFSLNYKDVKEKLELISLLCHE